MFRNILPPATRRPQDAQHDEVDTTGSTGPTPSTSNKENHPQQPVGSSMRIASSQPVLSPGLFPNTPRERHASTPMAQRDPRAVDREVLVENGAMHIAFDKMLDDLQIPETLRPKLQNLDTPVKAAMVRSSNMLTLKLPSGSAASDTPTAHQGSPTPSLRRAMSGGSLQEAKRSFDMVRPLTPPTFRPASPSPAASYGHSRGISLDVPRSLSSQQPLSNYPGGIASTVTLALPGKTSRAKDKENKDIVGGKLTKDKRTALQEFTPEKFSTLLGKTNVTQLPVEKIKKLRIMLRNEAASWSESFIIQGGYARLLDRLNEMLEVEWREEQRDDPILYELLRCFKALSTSSIGCFALRSSCPRPFVQLASLLYSDKKPGDVPTRQLIVELFHILLELYPAPAPLLPPTPGFYRMGHSRAASTSTLVMSPVPESAPTLPHPHTTAFSLLRAILLTPKPTPTESLSAPVDPHAFIQSLHTPRIYKVYLQELSDVCRDYFWVFCHPNNTIWKLNDVDVNLVEAPKAPGGMTGGVEYEAMGYLTSHFRLINALGTRAAEMRLPPEEEHSANRFHKDMFLSGVEKIIATARKASTAYYPTLHLELSRYVALAIDAQYELPWSLQRFVGLPPANVLRIAPIAAPTLLPFAAGISSRSSSPGRDRERVVVRSSTPGGPPVLGLPSPRKLEF